MSDTLSAASADAFAIRVLKAKAAEGDTSYGPVQVTFPLENVAQAHEMLEFIGTGISFALRLIEKGAGKFDDEVILHTVYTVLCAARVATEPTADTTRTVN
jgi:hypothetical protein